MCVYIYDMNVIPTSHELLSAKGTLVNEYIYQNESDTKSRTPVVCTQGTLMDERIYVYMYDMKVIPSHELLLCVPAYIHTYDMGWLRLVGSLKLYVSFAEYSFFYKVSFAKESRTPVMTYTFKAPTHRSHPIWQERWRGQ